MNFLDNLTNLTNFTTHNLVQNEVIVAEIQVDIKKVSNWGFPCSTKCVEQEQIPTENIPEVLHEYGIRESLKTLLRDINDIFAKTGFPPYPLVLIPWIWILLSWLYIDYGFGLPGTALVAACLISIPPIILIVFMCYMAKKFNEKRNTQINDAIKAFNETTKPMGFYIEMNEDYENYSKAILSKWLDRRYYNRNIFPYKEPKLLVKMIVSKRQKYCRKHGIEFKMPADVSDLVHLESV